MLSAMHTPGTGRQCGPTVSLSPDTLEWPSEDKQMREMDGENKSRRKGRVASTTNLLKSACNINFPLESNCNL